MIEKEKDYNALIDSERNWGCAFKKWMKFLIDDDACSFVNRSVNGTSSYSTLFPLSKRKVLNSSIFTERELFCTFVYHIQKIYFKVKNVKLNFMTGIKEKITFFWSIFFTKMTRNKRQIKSISKHRWLHIFTVWWRVSVESKKSLMTSSDFVWLAFH